MNTYDLNYPEQTRNIDAMLTIFTEERKKMIDDLILSPKKFKFSLVMDRNCCGHITSFKLITPKRPFMEHLEQHNACLRQGISCSLLPLEQHNARPPPHEWVPGTSGIRQGISCSPRSNLEERDNLFLTSAFQCVQCRNMSRIVDPGKGTGAPFKIESGRHIGNYLILLKEPNVIPNIVFQPPGYMKSDLFSNNVLITWMLESKLPKAIATHLCKMHTAYICGNDGYYLYNHPELGSLNQLTETVEIYFPDIDIFDEGFIKEYLKQIYVFLNYLGDDFIYGDLNIDSILFNFEETIYQWEEVFINCPITLKFSNFKCSSFKHGDQFTLSPHSSLLTVLNQSQLYKDTLSYFSKPRESFVLTESLTAQPLLLKSILYTHPKQFSSIFNLYSFILLLLLHPPIRKTVLSSPALLQLVSDLFGQSFLTETFDPPSSFEQILVILTNVKMRSNAFELLLSFLTEP